VLRSLIWSRRVAAFSKSTFLGGFGHFNFQLTWCLTRPGWRIPEAILRSLFGEVGVFGLEDGGERVVNGADASAEPALAQDTQIIAQAKIPFAFQAGSQVMPAGTYNISRQDHVLLLRETNSKAEEFLMVESASATHTPKTSTIVFDRRGDKYFLRSVYELTRP
jgi:hypothetical protein